VKPAKLPEIAVEQTVRSLDSCPKVAASSIILRGIVGMKTNE